LKEHGHQPTDHTDLGEEGGPILKMGKAGIRLTKSILGFEQPWGFLVTKEETLLGCDSPSWETDV